MLFTAKSTNPDCDFSNPTQRIDGGFKGINQTHCEALHNCFDDTIPDVDHCFLSKRRTHSRYCNYEKPEKRVNGGWPKITKEQCEELDNCFDDTIPDVVWCFKQNRGRSMNPKCDFSKPKDRLDGGWPGISKLECESLGYCFDDTILNVNFCIKSKEKLPSRNCVFTNPQKRVDAAWPKISREECLSKNNCFDDSTPNTIWCFKYNTGRTQDRKCDFTNPKLRIDGGKPGISKDVCESLGNCFDDTILDVNFCFVPKST